MRVVLQAYINRIIAEEMNNGKSPRLPWSGRIGDPAKTASQILPPIICADPKSRNVDFEVNP